MNFSSSSLGEGGGEALGVSCVLDAMQIPPQQREPHG